MCDANTRHATGPGPHIGLDFGSEGRGVSFQDGLDRRLPLNFVPRVVAATQAVARLAVPPAGEALAVPADRCSQAVIVEVYIVRHAWAVLKLHKLHTFLLP